MPIEIRCQKCGQKLRAPDKLAGKQVKCPKCAAAIRVEAPAKAEAAEKPGIPKKDSKPMAAQGVDEWYMQTDDGESYGPIPKSELDDWVKEGRIDSTCQVLQEGWDQWKWAEEVYPELAEAAGAADTAAETPFAGIGSSEGTIASANPYASPTAPTQQPSGEGQDGAITPATRRALAETRPWVLFLSILMFISVGLMLVGALILLVGAVATGMGIAVLFALLYLAFALVYLVPAYYLFTYAQRIGDFRRQGGVRTLEAAIVAQKSFWKFVGIVTAVFLVLGLVINVMAFLLGAMSAIG